MAVLFRAWVCAQKVGRKKNKKTYLSFVGLHSGTILHSSWQEIKLGTRSSMGIINPRWQRMHDNYKQKLCHSLWGKQLQGWLAMLNMNMDHRTKDLETDATAVLLKLVETATWEGRLSLSERLGSLSTRNHHYRVKSERNAERNQTFYVQHCNRLSM